MNESKPPVNMTILLDGAVIRQAILQKREEGKVYCAVAGHYVPKSDAIAYICTDCSAEIDLLKDKLIEAAKKEEEE